MKFEVIEVTQKQASEWLALNTDNRPVRKTLVKFLSDAMKRGEWMLTHQPIALNGDRLLDGQHRLMALVQSGLPAIKMTVCKDAHSATFDVIDIGDKRSMGDIYRTDLHVMHPISYIGRILSNSRQSPRALRKIYDRFHVEIRELVAMYDRNTRQFTAAPIKVGALAAVLDGEDKVYVHDVFRNICQYNIAELPRVGQIFVRQMTIDGAPGRKVQATDREQLLIRSFTVFHKDSAGLERLMVKDQSTRVAEIKDLFRKALGEE